jgi:hypothetical protein
MKKVEINLIIKLLDNLIKDKYHFVECIRNVSRQIQKLDDLDKNTLLIEGVEAETDDYPVTSSERNNWNRESLAELDSEINTYIEKVKPQVMEACSQLLKKYNKQLNDLQEKK